MQLLLTFSFLFILPLTYAGEMKTIEDFGKNPGQLNMFKFVPSKPKMQAPLVVILHGCNQDAKEFSTKSGWTKFAEQKGFYLLIPSQTASNNFMRCFNWFEKHDITRGKGEAVSIINMVKKMQRDHSINKQKVFVTGLSAGGAMALVMLATYPDVFKAGGVVAAIPYACATTTSYAFPCMSMQTTDRPAKVWGNLVREAFPKYRGNYPKLSIWQGTQDPYISETTAQAILKQWLNVHQVQQGSHLEKEFIKGHERITYKKNKKTVIESWSLYGHPHGQPIHPGKSHTQCGEPGEWIVDSDICAAYHMSRFWDIIP